MALGMIILNMENVSMDTTHNLLKQLYLEGKYQEAVDKLLEHKDQIDPGLFYFNLGTLQAKAGSVGASRHAFEQAIRLGHDSALLKNNLNYVNSEISKLGGNVEFVELRDQFIDFIGGQSIYTFLSISLILLIAFKVTLIKMKMKFKPIFILVVLFSFFPSIIKFSVDKSFRQAIVLKNDVVLTGPSKIFEKKTDVIAGSKVILGKVNSDWYLIESPVELAGWIRAENLAFLRDKK